MNPLRLVIVLLALAFALTGLGAQAVAPDSLLFPVASMDGQFVPLANPSLLGTGQIQGLGYAQNYAIDDWTKQHWLFYNSDGFSYVYENLDDVSHHSFALGSPASEHGMLWGDRRFGKKILGELVGLCCDVICSYVGLHGDDGGLAKSWCLMGWLPRSWQKTMTVAGMLPRSWQKVTVQ